MPEPVEELEAILDFEFAKFSEIEGPAGSAVTNIVREIDIVFLTLRTSNQFSPGYTDFFETAHQYGWPPLLRAWYSKIRQNDFQPILLSSDEITAWADAVIHATGKLARCRQVISWCKSGLAQLRKVSENEFVFSFENPYTNAEAFDLLDLRFVRNSLLNKQIATHNATDKAEAAVVEKRIFTSVRRPDGLNFQYQPTDRVAGYYARQGANHVNCLQFHDDFGPADLFDSIPYAEYVRMIEYLAGLAVMHFNYCGAAQQKFGGTDVRNIISVFSSREAVAAELARHLGRTREEAARMLTRVTLDEHNYENYLAIASVAPPPFVQISQQQLLRSAAGCLNNPFQFLNHELYRTCKTDHDKAVNFREDRFRQMIFSHFFTDDRFVRVPSEIKIRGTDIDAIVFDKSTGTLGLFQLKWQTPFGQSMQKRASVASNLTKNALKWLNTVLEWTQQNDDKTKLSALQITRHAPAVKRINTIRYFVIGRHSIHFTDVAQDERAAWGSWPQLLANSARVSIDEANPIDHLHNQLQQNTPKLRMEREGAPVMAEFELKTPGFRLRYQHNPR